MFDDMYTSDARVIRQCRVSIATCSEMMIARLDGIDRSDVLLLVECILLMGTISCISFLFKAMFLPDSLRFMGIPLSQRAHGVC